MLDCVKKSFKDLGKKEIHFQLFLFVLLIILSIDICIFLFYQKNLFGCIITIIGFLCLAGMQYCSHNCKKNEGEN